ncbi:MAG: hypothetical protein M0Z30_19555 [Actinomycetota bacterium]|nr:hypothetical protein [Actinomycetota bacterium]
MTETMVTPEEESKAAAADQYQLIAAQQDEYGWRSTMIDVGDYLVIFVRVEKPGGRSFVMRLRLDDYPEIAPELRFVAAAVFDAPSLEAVPDAQFYPAGPYVVAANSGRGPLPVPCIVGHRDYYAAGWHTGWTNPPTNEHTPYQLVMNVRNAILDHWS